MTTPSRLLEDLGVSFKEKRTVLMLGPRIATVQLLDREVPMLEGLARNFAGNLDAQNIPYEKDAIHNLAYVAQLCLREQKTSRDDLRNLAKLYIEENARDRIPAIYTELANLPVRVIVNTTPDDFIVRALRSVGKQPLVFNYNYEVNHGSERCEQTFRNNESIGVMQPLVFNLFGSTQDINSLVVTESDQVAFIRSIMGGSSRIPQEIFDLFTPSNTYLLFGFNLENWQLRLLLKTLKISELSRTVSPQTDNYPLTEVTKSFLRHEFNFHFVDERMGDFAREISTLSKGFDTESVYISYADDDSAELANLLRVFKILRATNPKLKIWHRGLVTSGDVEQQAREQLEKASIIIPVLSVGYLSDDRILDQELPLMQQRQQQGLAEVAPIALKSCLWPEISFFHDLQFLSPGDGPLLGTDTNEDEAYRSVVAAFKKRYL